MAAGLIIAGSAFAGLPATAASEPSGTVVDGVYEEPTNLNPILGPYSNSPQMIEASMFRNLFEALPNGTIAPELATVVPTVANGGISKNGLVYTIHLRKGIKWSDGQPFTAMDVWETYHVITSPLVNAVTTQGFDDIAKFQIVNPYEVRMTLKHPYAPFIVAAWTNTGPAIIPWHIFKNIPLSKVNTCSFNHDPTATLGPYKFQSWVPGTSITVTANPYWWGPKDKSKTIVFQIVPDQNTMLQDMMGGQINVNWFESVQQVPALKRIPGAKVFITPGPMWEFAQINFRNPILQDVRVREALMYAIDRNTLIQQVWDGYAKPLNSAQPPAIWAYNPHVQSYPYDPAMARKLLNEAGWKVGPGGFRYKDGKELTLVWSTTSGAPFRELTERLLAKWLPAVGIHLVVKNYDANALWGSIVPSGQGWDLVDTQQFDFPDPDLVDSATFETGGSLNFEKYSNPQLDHLYAEEQAATTQAQRKAIFTKIEEIQAKQLPALWLYAPDLIATTVHLKGYVPNPWYQDTWNCYDWQVTG